MIVLNETPTEALLEAIQDYRIALDKIEMSDSKSGMYTENGEK